MKSLTLRRKLLFGVGLIALLALGFVLLIPILQRSTERAFSAEQLKTEEGCAYWADKMDGPVHMQEYNRKNGGNPSWVFTMSTHYNAKLGQCVIRTESHNDQQDKTWHGTNIMVMAYGNNQFAGYRERDGEATLSSCYFFPKNIRLGVSSDESSTNCKSRDEFETFTKALTVE